MNEDQSGPKAPAVDPAYLAKAINHLTYCPYNEGSYFGRRSCTFVDVPVGDLKAILMRLHEVERQTVAIAQAMQEWARG